MRTLIRKSAAWIGLCLVLTGCGNPYRLNYVNLLDRVPTKPSFAPSTSSPRVVVSNTPREDAVRFIEDGYFPIGYVNFNSVKADEKLALAQAKEVGADLVVTSNQLTNTVTESVATPVYVGPETVRVDEYGSARNAGVDYSRNQTVTYEGHYQTEWVTQETAFYDQKALFLRRTTPPIFGAAVSPLPDELRAALQRNRGVLVRAVVKGSPAFRADLLKGDVLVGLEGEDVVEPGEFYRRIQSLAGQTVTLSVLRNGASINISVALAAPPPLGDGMPAPR